MSTSVAKSPKCLLIGSIEAYSGKSGIILGMGHQLQAQGFSVAYAKPLSNDAGAWPPESGEGDTSLTSQVLQLANQQVRPPLLRLDNATISKGLKGEDSTNYLQYLQQYIQELEGDLALLEGPGTLWEGSLFQLSVGQMAESIDASILLVAGYDPLLLVDSLLSAHKYLNGRLLGVVINHIPAEELPSVQTLVKPFLEQQGINVFGMLPQSKLLRSINVRQITQQLETKVLCRPDRLDLMVESLYIGAMNVNSALEYFRQGKNMAVITGSDRTDLQLAALETSTNCLILTGHVTPQELILQRAEDLEIPILSVDLDTLTAVEIIDNAFGKVPIQEPIKVERIQKLMNEHFDLEKFLHKLGLQSQN